MYMVKIVYKTVNKDSKHFLFNEGEKFVEKYAQMPGMDISDAQCIIVKEVPENFRGLDRSVIFSKMMKLM